MKFFSALPLTWTLLCAAPVVWAAAETPAVPPVAAPLTESAVSEACVAAPKRGNAKFFERHAEFLRRAETGPVGVLFLGDSITEGWKYAPAVWEKYFGGWQPANFGISGDQTQHVLWRIEQGELDKIQPKVVVLMIGTNNTGRHGAADIAAADRKIVAAIRAALPETKVLLLAIFPRGPRPDKPEAKEDAVRRMEVIRAVNVELAKLEDGDHVRFLDIGPRFLDENGAIPLDIMPDQLHLSEKGYALWAEAMHPLLSEMMR